MSIQISHRLPKSVPYRNQRGTGVMNRLFDSYKEYKGDITSRRNGVLIANSTGTSAYAIFNLQDRGIMFIDPHKLKCIKA